MRRPDKKFTHPLIVALMIVPTSAFAVTSRIVSINEVIEMAAKSPEVKSAQFISESAAQTYKSDKSKIFMPKIGATGVYTHLMQEQGLNMPSISSPLGTLNPPSVKFKKDLVIGSVSLVQPVIDPENMFYKADASKNSAEAESLTAKRQTKETQGTALYYYLQILELRAKRNALERYIVNLRSRQPEIKRLFQIGYVSESDVLKVKLGIDDANQGIREIFQKEDYLGQVLANLLGEDNIFSPQDLKEELPRVEVVSQTVDAEKREDIKSLDKQLSALEYSKKASKAAYLPKLSAYAAHQYADTDVLLRKDTDVVGLMVTWSIFDGGADLSEARASAEKKRSLEQKRFLAVGEIKASYLDSVNTLKIKKQEFEERKSAVVEAKKVTDIEFRRLRTGKTTVNNLIDAEDILKDRIEKASLSKVNWYQAWFSSQVASGGAINDPWEK